MPNRHLGVSLTRRERFWIWSSSAAVLLSLLALVFVALVFNVRTDNPFFLIFVYLLEIIAGISAGILSGTVIGFLKIEIERRVSRGTRIFIQGTGGFAVFLLVMIMSPRQQMANIADRIFFAQLADCRRAADSVTPRYRCGRSMQGNDQALSWPTGAVFFCWAASSTGLRHSDPPFLSKRATTS